MAQIIPSNSKEDQPRSEPVRRAYSPKEAAAALGVCERSIYNLIARGELPNIRVLTRRVIPVDAIERLLAINPGSSATPAQSASQAQPMS